MTRFEAAFKVIAPSVTRVNEPSITRETTMGLFENYHQEAEAIEKEIERKGVALGIDWTDEVQVRDLAREALTDAGRAAHLAAQHRDDRETLTRAELFGLAALMLKTMEQSAQDGMHTHGGPIWKTFGRALWQEAQNLKTAE